MPIPFHEARAARIAQNQADTLEAFIRKKAEIDGMLAQLQELSDEHFSVPPDAVNWGHVGTLSECAAQLSHIANGLLQK